MMSIWLADVNGRIVRAIVNKNLKDFIYRVSISLTVDFRFVFVCTTFLVSQLRDRLCRQAAVTVATAQVD
jgi:hypothetical protein